ncbi:MAG: 2-hydroxyacyl-CoA dehydratase [Deltaproteobacteria bacterium]|nr:2-hydroxyacyl-CoA dehydratase [Deltaproteobacteria bacterium]
MVAVVHTLHRLRKAGHRIAGCFPLYPPTALLHAFGFTPVVLWGLGSDAAELRQSDRHLQPFACAVARELSECLISAGQTTFDAVVSYNACDTLRNLPEILQAASPESGRSLPLLQFHLPAIPLERTVARSYLERNIEKLIAMLETLTRSAFSSRQFFASTTLYLTQHRLAIALEDAVGSGQISFAAGAELLQLAHILPVEEHIARLREQLAACADRGAVHAEPTRVMISGIVPPPVALADAIDAIGLRVVANDIASLHRSYGYAPAASDNPLAYYCDYYLNRPACPTISASADRRLVEIKRLINKSRSQGLIFLGTKFCEYEYFELPQLERMLRAEGIPTLRIELAAATTADSGASQLRLEAFAEMLRQSEHGDD